MAKKAKAKSKAKAKEEFYPVMGTEEYRRALERFGITIVGAAPVFAISKRQAQRYAQDSTPVPNPMAKLIRLCSKLKLDADAIAKL